MLMVLVLFTAVVVEVCVCAALLGDEVVICSADAATMVLVGAPAVSFVDDAVIVVVAK